VLLAADVSRIHSGHAKLLSADISATNSIHLSWKPVVPLPPRRPFRGAHQRPLERADL